MKVNVSKIETRGVILKFVEQTTDKGTLESFNRQHMARFSQKK